MPDWKKIKAEYIRGGISYRKLAAKYKVSPTTLQKRMKSEKWADLKKQKEIKSNAKIIESEANREAKRVDDIQTVADLLLKKIEQGVSDGSLIVDSQSIRQITASIKDLRDIKGCKSELDMQEQIARIEKLRKEAKEESTDTSIRVVIGGEAEDYSS